ncbi:FAS-associated death domain protein-like [Ciona intestinalis]
MEEEKLSEYRILLANVSERVKNLKELKFQCADWIGRGKMEKLLTALDLLVVLEERDKISKEDVSFLVQILSNTRRNDLAKLAQNFQSKWNEPRSWSSYDTYNEKSYSYSKTSQQCSPQSSTRQQLENQKKKANVPGFCVCHSMEPMEDFSQMYKALPFQSGDTPAEPPAVHNLQQDAAYLTGLNHLTPRLQSIIAFVGENLTIEWKMTMRHLDVPEHVLQSAYLNWPNNLQRAIQEALLYWARNMNPSPEYLITALRRSHRNDLADQIEETY